MAATPPPPVLTATVLYGGERIVVGGDGVTIGRDDGNALKLASSRVSRRHARIHADHGDWCITDLDSANGTLLNGERFRSASRWLQTGDQIVVGGESLHFLAGQETRMVAAGAAAARPAELIPMTGDRLRIGRDPANDVVLDDPNVSRVHAEVVRDRGRLVLRDAGSRNGTRVNGQPVTSHYLVPGSEVGIGPYRLVFDGTSFLARDDRGALRLDAERVTVRVRDKTILDEATLSVEPGTLVAIIGESGAGKSTLIRALGGISMPTSGSVTVNGEPVRARQTDVGYVPQDEIVHPGLTVREALRYAARLRLPRDATAADVEQGVERVLVELSLEGHADTRIGSLSGGQRKRAGVGTELLGQPSLLFLDEPTTGLDPGLESRMMRLLRSLADQSRAVVVVTHATKSLQLCDRIVVMGAGGHLCYEGPPRDALAFFGVEDIDDVYIALEDTPAIEWRARFESLRSQAGPAMEDVMVPPAARRPARPGGFGAAGTLTRRYARLLTRDRRNVIILLGQAPVLGLLMGLLFGRDTFLHAATHAGASSQLVFFLLITVVWMGAIAAAREIIRERSVLERERAIGVSTFAYLASKVAVLSVLSLAQCALLLVVVLGLRPLDDPPSIYFELIVVVAFTGLAGIAMGLVVSASVRSQEQATSLIPLVLIPQLLFGGSVVPVAEMSNLLANLSKVVFVQWSFAGAGTAIDLNQRFHGTGIYGTEFFDIEPAAACLVLLFFIGTFLAITALLIERRPVG